MSASERREPLVSREEAEAALAARRELGREFEPQLVDAFADRIERRVEERLRDRLPATRDRGHELAVTVLSIIFAIPMLGIAGATAGLAGIVAVCAALVAINVLARR